MGLGESIRNGDVPSHQFPLGPGYYSCSVWAFAITYEKACWFLHSWDLCPPYDVIHLAVTLLSGSASAAGQAVQTSSIGWDLFDCLFYFCYLTR